MQVFYALRKYGFYLTADQADNFGKCIIVCLPLHPDQSHIRRWQSLLPDLYFFENELRHSGQVRHSPNLFHSDTSFSICTNTDITALLLSESNNISKVPINFHHAFATMLFFSSICLRAVPTHSFINWFSEVHSVAQCASLSVQFCYNALAWGRSYLFQRYLTSWHLYDHSPGFSQLLPCRKFLKLWHKLLLAFKTWQISLASGCKSEGGSWTPSFMEKLPSLYLYMMSKSRQEKEKKDVDQQTIIQLPCHLSQRNLMLHDWLWVVSMYIVQLRTQLAILHPFQ